MHGECKNISIIAGHRGGAITLMHIKVDDQAIRGKAIALHQPCCHDRIVKAAESFAAIAISMMRSARKIDAHPIPKCGTAGHDGSACGSARPLHHLG